MVRSVTKPNNQISPPPYRGFGEFWLLGITKIGEFGEFWFLAASKVLTVVAGWIPRLGLFF